jgi:hypothetical protein
LLWRSPANPALATQNSSTAFLTRGSFAKFAAIRRALSRVSSSSGPNRLKTDD